MTRPIKSSTRAGRVGTTEERDEHGERWALTNHGAVDCHARELADRPILWRSKAPI